MKNSLTLTSCYCFIKNVDDLDDDDLAQFGLSGVDEGMLAALSTDQVRAS